MFSPPQAYNLSNIIDISIDETRNQESKPNRAKAEFEITMENHYDGDIFEHSFRLVMEIYLHSFRLAQIFLHHSDFSLLFCILKRNIIKPAK